MDARPRRPSDDLMWGKRSRKSSKAAWWRREAGLGRDGGVRRHRGEDPLPAVSSAAPNRGPTRGSPARQCSTRRTSDSVVSVWRRMLWVARFSRPPCLRSMTTMALRTSTPSARSGAAVSTPGWKAPSTARPVPAAGHSGRGEVGRIVGGDEEADGMRPRCRGIWEKRDGHFISIRWEVVFLFLYPS